ETVRPSPGPLRGASPEEIGLVARWLDGEGIRIVRASEGWCEPTRGAGRWSTWAELARDARAVRRLLSADDPHRLG
ncbi:hypothetical protein AK37_00070, partial [Rhodococcus pyridinivorans AK37]